MSLTIYQECIQRGVAVRNHYSDLYIPVTPETREMVKRHGAHASTFRNQVEGGLWYDVPLAYDPYWATRTKD